jgi:hypothetical protein
MASIPAARRTRELGHLTAIISVEHHDVTGVSAMATVWQYVRIQLMMFVFGIVGPIFLIIYFATQPDPTVKWAYWAGLFITAADVLIALALTSATGDDRASVREVVSRYGVSAADTLPRAKGEVS